MASEAEPQTRQRVEFDAPRFGSASLATVFAWPHSVRA